MEAVATSAAKPHQASTGNALQLRLERLRASIEAKQRATGEPLQGSQPSREAVQLPLWPEPVRGVPNGFLRSALFGAIKKGARRYMEREQLAALEGVEMRYTGQRLDQGDLDVWESVLHAARMQALGEHCHITSYALLKLMGKTDTGKNRATLHSRITRLVAGAVEVKQGRYTYMGSLIGEAFKDEKTQGWVIVVNPRLRTLFAADQFTYVEWAVRRALDGQPLAQWMHGFYVSHAKPYAYKVETLHRLCGSEAVRMDHFREKLRKALDAVADASQAHGEGFDYTIRGDLVHAEKKASGPQQRHLAKKAIASRNSRR